MDKWLVDGNMVLIIGISDVDIWCAYFFYGFRFDSFNFVCNNVVYNIY